MAAYILPSTLGYLAYIVKALYGAATMETSNKQACPVY